MKIKNIAAVAAIAAALLSAGACRSNQKVADSYSNYHFATTIVNTSPSGMLTVKAWGSGPNRAAAIEEAKRQALSDLIFKGIKGAKGYSGKALITEVNARERYAEYFDRFFARGGEYSKFVKEASSTDKSRIESKSNGRTNYGVTLDIDRSALLAQLRADGLAAQ